PSRRERTLAPRRRGSRRWWPSVSLSLRSPRLARGAAPSVGNRAEGRCPDDHSVVRPLRLRASLPRQRYFPKAASTSFCCRNLIIRRSAASTVCFLVACPDAFWLPP